MSNETQQPTTTDSKQMSFGARLKSTREAKGFDRKDAAAQLRLTEKIIAMMEYERYPADMPVTFIKGYIRAYGKLLQIPEHEVKKALAPIKPKPVLPSFSALKDLPEPLTSGNYFMQLFTYLILFTIVGLVGMWWYTHPTLPTTTVVENPPPPPPATENTPAANNQPNTTAAIAAPPALQPSENNVSPSIAVSNNTSAQTPIENNATTQASPTLAPAGSETTSVENSSAAPAENTTKDVSENNTTEKTKNSATSEGVEDNTSAEQNNNSTDSGGDNASENNSNNEE